MPLPSEHACRLISPDSLNIVGSETRDAEGKKYRVIFGVPKSGGASVEQAYRYPLENGWTAEQAQKHCSAHDGTTFEPASKQKAELTFLACLHSLKSAAGKNLATFYLMNTSKNRNGWGVSDKALVEALPTLVGKPLGVGAGYDDSHHPANPMEVGTFLNFNKPNGYATATVDITDPKAWELLKARKLGPISVVFNNYRSVCSKCGRVLPDEKTIKEHPCIVNGVGYEQVESFVFSHVDFVNNPAYPQAGALRLNAEAPAILNPIQYCASAYESQSFNYGSPGTPGQNPVKAQKGEKLEKTTEQLQAELDKANKKIETMEAETKTVKAELEKLKKASKPESPEKLKTLEADLKKTQDELDAIKKATHEKLLTEAVDKRFEAGLIAKKEDERERIAKFSDEVLKMLASDADTLIKRNSSIKPGPRTRYTGEKDEDSKLTEAMRKRAAELGLNPELGLSTVTPSTKEA